VLLNLTSSSGKLDLPAGTRVTGAPVLHVTATPMTPDPVIHATWYDTDASGKMTWVGEAVRRGALSDDLTGTRTITPGTAMPWTIQFYPMDTELQPGHTWSIVLGTQPNGAPGGGAGLVITPAQEQVQYDAGTMMVQVRTLDSEMGLDAVQPTLMKCFTC
jgi:predicted acyl esterase